jgi:AraC-like DNA-binding protein
MGLSQSQLYRKIKALTLLSTAAFIRRVRLQEGKRLLETTELTVSEVAYEVGFTTPGYFSDAFLEEFGTRPHAMRK